MKETYVFLPNGYKWEHFSDGTGYIVGPDKKHYFAYDKCSDILSEYVRYRRTEEENWKIFNDTFLRYKKCVNSIFLEFMVNNIGDKAGKVVV